MRRTLKGDIRRLVKYIERTWVTKLIALGMLLVGYLYLFANGTNDPLGLFFIGALSTLLFFVDTNP